jgi:hypothetical protein
MEAIYSIDDRGLGEGILLVRVSDLPQHAQGVSSTEELILAVRD